MGLAKLKERLSADDYLAGEEVSDLRFEFLHGEVYAMAGTSDSHNFICGNLFGNLWNHLRDAECEPFVENMKVRVADDIFYYPDVLVSCEQVPESRYFRNEPVLIIEVISPSTVRTDRLEKLPAYQAIQSVKEILLVDQDKIWIEVYRRQADGGWMLECLDESDAMVELTSVGMTIQVSEVYRRVDLISIPLIP